MASGGSEAAARRVAELEEELRSSRAAARYRSAERGPARGRTGVSPLGPRVRVPFPAGEEEEQGRGRPAPPRHELNRTWALAKDETTCPEPV